MAIAWLGPRHYGHWKRQEILGPSGTPLGLVRSVEGSLIHELHQLLPTLMGARDYRGAAAVLSVIYTHFMSDPAACVTTSLEILRRLPDTTPTLVEFYQTLLDWQSVHVSSDVIIRERFLLYLLQGDLHEAYAYYKEHMQLEVLQQDVHVVAAFGMVCYWLLFREDQDIRDEYIATSQGANDDDRSASTTGWFSQETQLPIHHVIGTATLYQEALVSFRRAMTLSPESNVFVEYYVQVLVMKNDIELAADYLEHFYHLHPTEPHACRMLFHFFVQFFPDSTACRVDICVRWNTLDPSTLVPLQALVDAFEKGLVTKDVLVTCLCHSLDHCASDMYQRLHPDTSLWTWQQLADLLGPVVFPVSLPALSGPVAACFASRQWWRRVYVPTTSPASELTRVQVLQCVVAVRVWGADALSATLRLSDLVAAPDDDTSTIAKRFHLHALDISPTPPPSADPIVRSWTTQLSWRPSRGQLRTPHVLKRPQVLTSFDLEDAVQVHEVAADAAPPPCRIHRPLDADVVRPADSTPQHPYLWLMSQRSGRTNPWHVDLAATISHEVPPSRETSVSVDAADTPIMTDKDCVAVATEDELLLCAGQERSVTLHHLLTSYLYKNLPVPATNQQASAVIRALRRKHPFQPDHRVPAKFLHWIQHYMTRHGVRATATKCRQYLEAQWRRHGGRCRGLPSTQVVELAMAYFKVNPAILPRRVRDRFRTFVASHGKHIPLVDLCREFYSQLEARHPSNLPFFSVLFATTKQWMAHGLDRGIRAVVPCFPPTVRKLDDDDDAWTKALNEEPPVAEALFVTPENERYLSSIKAWLEAESPITNAMLVYYMHMHFDATCPDFPSPPSVLTAMIDYVRVQLHAEHADVPSMEDSIYYSRPKAVHKPKYRRYLEACVVRHPHVPFEEIVRIMLDKAQLPPFKDNVPTLRELHGWWRAAVNDLVATGLGLGSPAPTCTVDEADEARIAPKEESLGDIETAKKKLPKMLNLPDDMEVFAI